MEFFGQSPSNRNTEKRWLYLSSSLHKKVSMNKYGTILFRISMLWILLCLFILTIGQFLPFEFTNNETTKGFYGLIWGTMPIAFILTLIKENQKKIYKILTVLVAFACLPILAIYTLVGGMCSYSNGTTLFTNKSDSSLIILERYYGCGAYDSDIPKPKFFKMQKLTENFAYSTKIDTLDIEKQNWLRVFNH